MSADPVSFVDLVKGFGGLGGPLVGALGLGWWLSGRFRKLEVAGQDRLEKIVEAFRVSISSHEALDQMRHEQNLAKFTDISITLARAGLNGRHKAAGGEK